MERDIALTRPILSPSQPKTRPPQAAPKRNMASIQTFQVLTMAPSWSAGSGPNFLVSRLLRAGPAIWGMIPISRPSNIQPRKAARRTRIRADWVGTGVRVSSGVESSSVGGWDWVMAGAEFAQN